MYSYVINVASKFITIISLACMVTLQLTVDSSSKQHKETNNDLCMKKKKMSFGEEKEEVEKKR